MVYRHFARFWHNVERQRERELYAALHASLYAKGWTHQVSFYGTTKEPYDGVHYQARIEVVSRSELKPSQLAALYRYLTTKQPDGEYTFYVCVANEIKRVIMA